MAKKPTKSSEYREILYSVERWATLEEFRQKATGIMEILEKAHLETIVHGSIARGDVNKKSDVDVFIPWQTPSFNVENALEQHGIAVSRRLVVQATPTYAMKAYLEIEENSSVWFSVMNVSSVGG